MNDPPDDGYAITDITLTPWQARHIIELLIDVHGVLDHLYLDGTNPDITAIAEGYLHAAVSEHTMVSLIEALNGLTNQLIWTMRDQLFWAMRETVTRIDTPRKNRPVDF
jgi:hypothetical protein